MKLAVAFWIFFASLQQVFSATPREPLAQKWVARYNGPSNREDFSSAIATDSAGDVYSVGYTRNYLEGSSSYAEAILIKYDGITGTKIWEWRQNNRIEYFSTGPAEVMTSVARLRIGTDGNPVILTGSQLYKIHAADGMQLWTVALPPPASYTAYYGLELDAAADVFVCGFGAGRLGGITLKFSGLNGVKLWERQSSSNARLEAVAVDLDGNAIVTGSDFDRATGREGLYTAKYSALDGSVRWERWLTDPYVILSARLITVDPGRNPVAVTTSGLIVKYAAADGELLWQKKGEVYPYDLLCDSAGDILVASSRYTVTSASGAALSKYAGTDGTLRWGGWNWSSEFFCSLLLRGNEILVAGQRGDDLLLAAFDPLKGSRRWDVTYGMPLLKDRMASTYRPNGRIALQPDGGVVITGCSQGTSTDFDFATLRYAPGPAIRTAGAVWVLQTSAKLFAQASGNGMDGTLVLEYGPTAAYGHTTEPILIKPGLDPGTYQTIFTDLPENTTFHARAVATSAAGITYGEDFVFTTGWDANGNDLPDQWELNKWGYTSEHFASGDDDRDGLPNLLEYAFGQNPLLPNSPGAVPITQVGDYLTATITKQPFVTYTVEASSDLQTWSTANTTILADDATTLSVRGNTPFSSGGSQFLRIRVTAQ